MLSYYRGLLNTSQPENVFLYQMITNIGATLKCVECEIIIPKSNSQQNQIIFYVSKWI